MGPPWNYRHNGTGMKRRGANVRAKSVEKVKSGCSAKSLPAGASRRRRQPAVARPAVDGVEHRLAHDLAGAAGDEADRRVEGQRDACRHRDHRPAGWLCVEETARQREIAAGNEQQCADGRDWDQPEQLAGGAGKAKPQHQQHQAQQHGRQARACPEPVLRLHAAGPVAHRHGAERCQRQVGEACRQRKVALARPRGGRGEEIARHQRRHDHRVGERQRQLRQHEQLEAAPDLGPRRHGNERETAPGECHIVGRLHQTARIADSNSRAEHRRRGRKAPHQHQPRQQRQGRHPDPRRAPDQLEAQQSHRQAETQLQPGRHRLRNDPRQPADRAGRCQHQQDHPDRHARRRNLARAGLPRHQHGRHRLHRLHRHRQAVEKAAGHEEGAEAGQHSGGRKARHGDSADHMREEGAEVAARAGCLGRQPPPPGQRRLDRPRCARVHQAAI